MHQYLKSIGFGKINKKRQLKEILDQVETSYTEHHLIVLDEETDFCEYEKEY